MSLLFYLISTGIVGCGVFLLNGYLLSIRTGIKWISFLPMIMNSRTMHQYIANASKNDPIVMQYLGIGNHVILCDTESIKFVLRNDNKFVKMIAPTTECIKEFVGKNVMNTNGDEYEFHKAPIMQFLSNTSVKSFEDKMTRQAENLVDILSNYVDKEINIGNFMVDFTFDVLSDTILGIDIGASNDVVELSHAIEVFTREITNPMYMLVPGYEKLPIQSNRELKHSIDVLQKYIEKIIREKEGKSVDQYDLIDCILENSKNSNELMNGVFGNIITLIIAGHDTTAISLKWVMYYLSIHLDIQTQLYNDIKEGHESELMQNVFKETMRMMPPVALVPTRTCTEDIYFTHSNGKTYTFKKGSFISYSIWAVHRNEKIWNNPGEWMPSRWTSSSLFQHNAGSSSLMEESLSRQHNDSYMPFSTGKRPCLGKQFAIQEQRIVLTEILKKFEIHSEGNHLSSLELKPGIFAEPKKVIVKLTLRN